MSTPDQAAEIAKSAADRIQSAFILAGKEMPPDAVLLPFIREALSTARATWEAEIAALKQQVATDWAELDDAFIAAGIVMSDGEHHKPHVEAVRELVEQNAALRQRVDEAEGEIKDWRDGSDAEAHAGDEARAALTTANATIARQREALSKVDAQLGDAAHDLFLHDLTGDTSRVFGVALFHGQKESCISRWKKLRDAALAAAPGDELS